MGCEEKEPATSAKVRTGQVTNITDESALIEASVNVDISKYNSVNFGVMYSTYLEDINFRNGNEEFASYMNGKEYEVEITDLSPNTKYYYCAYLVLNGIQREFGQIKEFTTLPANGGSEDEGGSEEDEGGSEEEDEGGSEGEGEGGTEDEGDGKVNGYAYVDLGLSRNACSSTISGSRAAFKIRVVPSALQAASIRFSVAPTEGRLSAISQPRSRPPLHRRRPPVSSMSAPSRRRPLR